jgi:hypothetical protein
MSLCEKVPGKCALGLQHERLNGPEEATEWRQFWKDLQAGEAN